ncbi:MAG: hypothetical protein ACI87T_002094, partial [Planctomycetota bacterium]
MTHTAESIFWADGRPAYVPRPAALP